eukprot:CAMPEP_0174282126 /NCGR_PEP_ID=MMETSP0809-20121228/2590_1 /TAXON_ID=73025 ORGANISM="Eutreptiella gymnastica-like, Strain CCMP1594" /NCGR_SAMPLE_ID=MMETSP0809 /ASSEMBLY_ACC=CAM_ASM_000658 /LENGTH=89 /DNA_ID=CAMNT_0015376121 /DNA_START=177 /DNA_END=444 /DNA_ORIENTATION=+
MTPAPEQYVDGGYWGVICDIEATAKGPDQKPMVGTFVEILYNAAAPQGGGAQGTANTKLAAAVESPTAATKNEVPHTQCAPLLLEGAAA